MKHIILILAATFLLLPAAHAVDLPVLGGGTIYSSDFYDTYAETVRIDHVDRFDGRTFLVMNETAEGEFWYLSLVDDGTLFAWTGHGYLEGVWSDAGDDGLRNHVEMSGYHRMFPWDTFEGELSWVG